MNQFDQFQNALLLESVSENTYSINPDSRYFVGKTPHGGYLNALMHKALISAVPHSVAISSSIQYLDRIEAKDIILEVEIFKVSSSNYCPALVFLSRLHPIFGLTSIFHDRDWHNGSAALPAGRCGLT